VVIIMTTRFTGSPG